MQPKFVTNRHEFGTRSFTDGRGMMPAPRPKANQSEPDGTIDHIL